MVNKKRLNRMYPYGRYSKRTISPRPDYSFWDFILLVSSLLVLTLLLIGLYDKVLARSAFFMENKIYFNVIYYYIVAAISIGFIWGSRFTFLRKGFQWLTESLKSVLPKGKSLWDLLSLVGGAALLGTVGGIIGFFVTTSNQENDSKLQNDAQQQTILTNYIQDMSKLIEEDTRNPKIGLLKRPEMRISFKARTLNTLEKLNGDKSRQAYALRFAARAFPDFSCLDQSKSEQDCPMPRNINLKGINLSGFVIDQDSKKEIRALFQGADLESSNLSQSNLIKANLSVTKFTKANLSNGVRFPNEPRYLRYTSFEDADLTNSSLENIDLSETKYLETATLKNTYFNEMTSFPAKETVTSPFTPFKAKDFDVCSFIQPQDSWSKFVNSLLQKSQNGLIYQFPPILSREELEERKKTKRKELNNLYNLYVKYYNYDKKSGKYVYPEDLSSKDGLKKEFNEQLQKLYGEKGHKCEKQIAY